jgi:hypothetical protein
MIILCLLSFWLCTEVFISNIHPTNQFKENIESFAIDSIDYHPSGRDNTLQVSPYWKCHLKGTNVWVRVNENKEVGDSLSMIIKY